MIEKNALIGVIHNNGDRDVFERDWTINSKEMKLNPEIILDAVDLNVEWFSSKSNKYKIYLFYKAVKISRVRLNFPLEKIEFCKKLAKEWEIEPKNICWVEGKNDIYFYENNEPELGFPVYGKDFSESFITSFLWEEASDIIFMIRHSAVGDIRRIDEVYKMENIRHFSADEILDEAGVRDKNETGYILAWESINEDLETYKLEAYSGEIIIECVAKMGRVSPLNLVIGLIGLPMPLKNEVADIIKRMIL